ncbi:MAG: helix-turn-helix transcriptional regulator [Lacisediminihabitans sp.]
MTDFTSRMTTLPEWEGRIGNAVRQLRIESGFGQVELAERADVSRSAVQALENGSSTRLRTLLSVLRALNRTDALDGIMPPDGPSPLEALAEARRRAKKPQRYRKPGE